MFIWIVLAIKSIQERNRNSIHFEEAWEREVRKKIRRQKWGKVVP